MKFSFLRSLIIAASSILSYNPPAQALATLGLTCGGEDCDPVGIPDLTKPGDIICAPEVQQGNIATAEATLNSLASHELAGNTKFRILVDRAQKLPEDQKLKAYLGLLGIHTPAEIIELVSERQINPKYVHALEKNGIISSAI